MFCSFFPNTGVALPQIAAVRIGWSISSILAQTDLGGCTWFLTDLQSLAFLCFY